MSLIFVDCEAPYWIGSPSIGDMTEFGAVEYETLATFHGINHNKETFQQFWDWLKLFKSPYVFVSDNPAYDWQWINFYFYKYFNTNPMGHSARRIGDFYAGMKKDFRETQKWKRLRKTKHDHNPVNDAMGNVEAFKELINECSR